MGRGGGVLLSNFQNPEAQVKAEQAECNESFGLIFLVEICAYFCKYLQEGLNSNIIIRDLVYNLEIIAVKLL